MNGPRSVVVTGGGKGIGRALVEAFAGIGDRVVALGRDEDALASTVELLGGRATAVCCDVTDEADVERTFAKVGRVDVLVNNAGFAESAPLARTTLDVWRLHLDVNATGPFLCTRAVLPAMSAGGSGRIVTVASVAGRAGMRYTAAYAASKHASVGLMRAVAAEVAGTGVTANAVCPAYVRTEMTERAVARIVDTTGRSAAEAVRALATSTPLHRLLEPDEVVAAVLFLASPEAGAINGQAIVVDGGGINR